jgi:hypothetical protein
LTVAVRVTTVPEATDMTGPALEVTVRVVVVGVAAEATVPASRMVLREARRSEPALLRNR